VHRFKVFFAFIVAALGAITPAYGYDVGVTVTPVPTSVTLSRPAPLLLATFASYKVVIENYRPQAINGVRLVATTTVVSGTDTAKFFAAQSDPRCAATNIGQTSISCALVQVAPGASESFTVTVKAPTDGTKISFAWQVVWDESGVPGSDGPADTAYTALTQPSAEDVTTYVPAEATATTLFTGTSQCTAIEGCAATSTDPWTTTVRLPQTPNAVTANVLEKKDEGCARAADLLDCRQSAFTLSAGYVAPGDTYITITLRRDQSTITRHARIASARVYYNPVTSSTDVGNEVLSCDDSRFINRLPTPGTPCLDYRVAYPKKATPNKPVPPDYEGDWVFVIRAKDNGKYAE
jgi:hypothetical protein